MPEKGRERDKGEEGREEVRAPPPSIPASLPLVLNI